MDNSQFRSLLQNTADVQHAAIAVSETKRAALGSRERAFVPMTPRSIAGRPPVNKFAQLVDTITSGSTDQPPLKKFKSSSAPKGTKLPQGYQDRVHLRHADAIRDAPKDDKEKRVSALEDMFKLQQIDQPTFNRLKAEIGVGGDMASTHLVKGLDWKLLERVRKGEDINEEPSRSTDESSGADAEAGLDAALDSMAERATSQARSELEPELPTSSQQGNSRILTRDEILQRFKASRTASQAQPSENQEGRRLSEKFKKVAATHKVGKTRFIETVNGRRREVLIRVDRDGKTKRKIRWMDEATSIGQKSHDTSPMRKPLGMEVPAEIAAKQRALEEEQRAREEDEDIFEGVGADYNPLGDIGNESAESPSTEEETVSISQPSNDVAPVRVTQKRDYFATSTGTRTLDDATASLPIIQDPNIQAALRRAAELRKAEHANSLDGRRASGDYEDINEAQQHKQRALLEKLRQREREDLHDVDLGFGESRFGDDDEDGNLEDQEGKKGGRRKRGPKKRRGDKDDFKDVMEVLSRKSKPSA